MQHNESNESESSADLHHVVMIKSNLIDIDSRLTKEYYSLKKLHYAVSLLCWNREGKEEISDDYSPIEALNIRSPYGIKSLFLLPIWALYSFIKLLLMKYDIIHVINFDSYIPSLIAAKIRGKPIIYEIEDTYEDQILMPNFIREIVLGIDRHLSKFADAIILVDECQLREFGDIPNSNVHIIYDSPPDFAQTFTELNSDDGIFKILYPGVFFRARKLNIDKIIEFVLKHDNIQLTLCGYGDMKDELIQLANERPDKIRYLGWIPSRVTVFQLLHDSDLTFAFKDTSIPLNRYICGSKIFEAMMCSVPIIVNANTSVSMKVRKNNCGIVINVKNESEVESALLKLIGDRQYCRSLGENGRRAYSELYRWDIMEDELYAIYKKLL